MPVLHARVQQAIPAKPERQLPRKPCERDSQSAGRVGRRHHGLEVFKDAQLSSSPGSGRMTTSSPTCTSRSLCKPSAMDFNAMCTKRQTCWSFHPMAFSPGHGRGDLPRKKQT
jgi:hypothetical protein